MAEDREYPPHLILHAEFGQPSCQGLLFHIERGGRFHFQCKDCGAIVQKTGLNEVPAAIEAMRMEKGEVVALVCPHCGEITEAPGWAGMFAFTCRHCGRGVLL